MVAVATDVILEIRGMFTDYTDIHECLSFFFCVCVFVAPD